MPVQGELRYTPCKKMEGDNSKVIQCYDGTDWWNLWGIDDPGISTSEEEGTIWYSGTDHMLYGKGPDGAHPLWNPSVPGEVGTGEEGEIRFRSSDKMLQCYGGSPLRWHNLYRKGPHYWGHRLAGETFNVLDTWNNNGEYTYPVWPAGWGWTHGSTWSHGGVEFYSGGWADFPPGGSETKKYALKRISPSANGWIYRSADTSNFMSPMFIGITWKYNLRTNVYLSTDASNWQYIGYFTATHNVDYGYADWRNPSGGYQCPWLGLYHANDPVFPGDKGSPYPYRDTYQSNWQWRFPKSYNCYFKFELVGGSGDRYMDCINIARGWDSGGEPDWEDYFGSGYPWPDASSYF